MADKTTIDNLIKYYQDLLILQYRSQPKAKATIELFVDMILQNGILLDVQQAFDPLTAVGKQLDILGKWIGVDRYYTGDGITQQLSDDDYRIILNFKVICNAINMSPSAIDNGLHDIFGDKIICSTNDNLVIYYFVDAITLPLATILLEKKVLPKPLGVRLGGIIENKIYFGFCNSSTYNDMIPDTVAGFANSTNFLTKEGEFLESSDIIR